MVKNRDGADVKRGIRSKYTGDTELLSSFNLFYCGRLMNECRCGGCDGRCGPKKGCPCNSCLELVGFKMNCDGYIAKEGPTGNFYCGWRKGGEITCPEAGPCNACSELKTKATGEFQLVHEITTADTSSNSSVMELSFESEPRLEVGKRKSTRSSSRQKELKKARKPQEGQAVPKVGSNRGKRGSNPVSNIPGPSSAMKSILEQQDQVQEPHIAFNPEPNIAGPSSAIRSIPKVEDQSVERNMLSNPVSNIPGPSSAMKSILEQQDQVQEPHNIPSNPEPNIAGPSSVIRSIPKVEDQVMEQNITNKSGSICHRGSRTHMFGGDTGMLPRQLYYCGQILEPCRCGCCGTRCGPDAGCPCSACFELVLNEILDEEDEVENENENENEDEDEYEDEDDNDADQIAEILTPNPVNVVEITGSSQLEPEQIFETEVINPHAQPDVPDDSKLCIICLENDKNCVVTPCGHYAYCEECVEPLHECAVCRGSIVSFVKVFEP